MLALTFLLYFNSNSLNFIVKYILLVNKMLEEKYVNEIKKNMAVQI